MKFKKIFVIIILENQKRSIDKIKIVWYTVYTVKKGSALNGKKSEVVKIDFMQKVKNFLESEGETVLQIKSGTYSIPWALDGDEGYLNLTFSVPKGTRDGDLFDGYEEAENYRFESEAKAKAKAEREEKKQKKMEKDRLAREKAKAKKAEREIVNNE